MNNIFYRMLLALYGVCLMFISLLTILLTLKPEIFDRISDFISTKALSTYVVPTFFIAFIFFIISFTFLFSGFKSYKSKQAVTRMTDIGDINISLDTIGNIAISTCRKITGVRDSKGEVKKLANGVLIIIKVVTLSEVNIPNVSEEIQKRVKKSVEEISGVNVQTVKVIVDNVYHGLKSRVE